MQLSSLLVISLVVLVGFGAYTVMTASKAEGFEPEKNPDTDDNVDYFVTVANVMKKLEGGEPSAAEVRRTVSDMRRKKVSLDQAEKFVKTRGGRIAAPQAKKKQPAPKQDEEEQEQEQESDEEEEDEQDASKTKKYFTKKKASAEREGERDPPRARPKPKALPQATMHPNPDSSREPFENNIAPAMADRLVRELTAFADRLDDLVEEIRRGSRMPAPEQQHQPAPAMEPFSCVSAW